VLRRKARLLGGRKDPPPDALIVGLGNPGPDHEGQRHNIGFEIADMIADRHGGSWRTARQRAMVCEVRVAEHRVALAKPQTYMNNSGESVKALVVHYGVDTAQLLVAHDDLDIDFGLVRLKFGGGPAGHNGLKSIIAALGTGDFARLRFGIGRPPGRMDPVDYVLRPFRPEDIDAVAATVGTAADMAESWLAAGVEATQNRYH
jgi:PTH1 family peptidyl-tRNA hydrolase